MAPALEVVPLGGLGEFGMNMMAVSWGDDDHPRSTPASMFPDPELLGVDLVIPDLALPRAARRRRRRRWS